MKAAGIKVLPIVVAGLAGAIVALNLKGAPAPQPSDSAERATDTLSPRSEPVSPTAPSANAERAPASVVPDPSAPAAAPTSPGTGAAAIASASPSATPEPSAPPPAFDLTPPATREELTAVEVRCDRKVPEDCERAARALDAGTILPRDAPRAAMLRRIALTRYVKQCEADRAQACARLAEMHERGELLQPNPANAKALRRRVQELCSQEPAQPGCAAPPP